jgi:hypothetical protein
VNEHLFIGNLNAVESRRQAFHSWYATHVCEIVDNIDGFVAVRRYGLSSVQREDFGPSPWRFLTIYELEGEDVDAIHEANTRVRESGIYTPHDGAIEDDHVAHVFTPVADQTRNDDAWGGRSEATHAVVVRSNPAPGREDEYNVWYDQHVREVIASIDGYVAAQRFQLNPSQRPGMPASRWQYIVIYDLAADDLAAVHRSNLAARAAGAFTPPAGVLADDYIAHAFTPIGHRVVARTASQAFDR